MEHILEKTKPYHETTNAKNVQGARVLSKGGFVVGKVSEIRINSKNFTIEGIVVKKLRRKIFIGRSYIEKISDHAIILTTLPSVLLKGKKVITNSGETLGKVKQVLRQAQSNNIEKLQVYSVFRGNFNVSKANIKSIGNSIILKDSYNAPKKKLWGRK